MQVVPHFAFDKAFLEEPGSINQMESLVESVIVLHENIGNFMLTESINQCYLDTGYCNTDPILQNSIKAGRGRTR